MLRLVLLSNRNHHIIKHPRDEKITHPGDHFILHHLSVIFPANSLSTALTADRELTLRGHVLPGTDIMAVIRGGTCRGEIK